MRRKLDAEPNVFFGRKGELKEFDDPPQAPRRFRVAEDGRRAEGADLRTRAVGVKGKWVVPQRHVGHGRRYASGSKAFETVSARRKDKAGAVQNGDGPRIEGAGCRTGEDCTAGGMAKARQSVERGKDQLEVAWRARPDPRDKMRW